MDFRRGRLTYQNLFALSAAYQPSATWRVNKNAKYAHQIVENQNPTRLWTLWEHAGRIIGTFPCFSAPIIQTNEIRQNSHRNDLRKMAFGHWKSDALRNWATRAAPWKITKEHLRGVY
jgi:hypothetical protein